MISRVYLALNAVGIGLIGLAYLYQPNLLLSQYGLGVESVGVDNMIRSTYGGVFLAAAAIFVAGVFHPKRLGDALGFAALFMGGLALGRLASIASVGAPPEGVLLLLYYEAAAAVVAAGLYLRSSAAD